MGMMVLVMVKVMFNSRNLNIRYDVFKQLLKGRNLYLFEAVKGQDRIKRIWAIFSQNNRVKFLLP